MLNKSIFSILVAVLLSFGNPLRAMENPEQGGISMENLPIDESTKVKAVDSLKRIAACKVDALIMDGIDLRTADGLSLSGLPEELREYAVSVLINEYCAPLKQLKEEEKWLSLNITEENLENFKKLLYELLGCDGKSVKTILLSLDNYCIKNLLHDVCMLLHVLIQRNGSYNYLLSQEEQISCNKIISHALWQDKIELFRLLISNKLFPRLNDIINVGNSSGSFFKAIALYCKDIDLFNSIIAIEESKECCWSDLLGLSGGYGSFGSSVLHCAVESTSKDKVEAILKLIQEQGLSDFIDAQDVHGRTALMIAAVNGDCEIVELLINNGASINIVPVGKVCALVSARRTLADLEYVLNDVNLTSEERNCFERRMQAALKCVELLGAKG